MSTKKAYFDKKHCTDKCTDTDSEKNLRKRNGVYYYRFYYNDITTGEKREVSKSLKTKNKAEAIKLLKIEKEKLLQKFISKFSTTDVSFLLSEPSGYFMKYNSGVKYLRILDKEYHGLQNGSIFHEYPLQRMKELNILIQQTAYYRDENWLLGLKISGPKEYKEFLEKHGLKTVQDHQALMNREELGLEYYYKSDLETEERIPSLTPHTDIQQPLAQSILTPTPIIQSADTENQPQSVQVYQPKQYTIEDIVNSLMKKKDLKEGDKIEQDIYRAFRSIGVDKSDIFQPINCKEDYLDKMIEILKEKNFCSSTIKHYKAHIKYFFKEVQYKYGEIESIKIGDCINTLEELKLKAKPSNPFKKFTQDQLRTIFSKDNTDLYNDPDILLGAILGLFTGSRKSLAHTLQYKNIFQKNGTWYIDFTDVDKRYKNHASLRVLPVHPQLIDIGFVDFINKKKKHDKAKNKDFIFKDLINEQEEVKTTFTKKWDHMLKHLGIKVDETDRYVFHSCRKTAANTMRDCGVEENFVDGLVGWEGQGTQNKNYVVKNSEEDFIHTNNSFNYDFLKDEFTYLKEYLANYFNNK